MKTDLDTVVIENNSADQRFEAKVGRYLAVVEYQRGGDIIVFTHTEVPEELEGQRIAGKLDHAALEYARAQQLTVVPLCPFVASYIRRHQEYIDLVHPQYRAAVVTG